MHAGFILALLLLVGLLAYANGANDVSKGIATLAGSGVTSYRRAIFWGAIWTMASGDDNHRRAPQTALDGRGLILTQFFDAVHIDPNRAGKVILRGASQEVCARCMRFVL